MTNLTNPIFSDENAARAFLEGERWPNGPFCPHCGSTDKIAALNGKSMGPGWYYCGDCEDKFTIRVGSIFERSHVPLCKWLLAFRLMAGSKKGMSAHQMHRQLGVTYKTAWFMGHRIRESMRSGPFDASPMGGRGKIVEADETYIGRKKRKAKGPGPSHKHAVLALVERGGEVRSFHIGSTKMHAISPLVRANIAKESKLATDEASHYDAVGSEFAGHLTVDHSKEEYVRGEAFTNTAEGYFSIFKRGMKGIYQHCSEKHLHRYLAEFDFRYSNRIALGVDDVERTARAIRGAEGKRLTYQQPTLRLKGR
jgi:transposase-like protein